MEGADILQYDLPEERIAKYPLDEREASKQLIYRKGVITDKIFRELPDQLPAGARLFFNDTKVIPARLHFYKSTGALIECFLLEPISPSSIVSQAMEETGMVTWKCMVGNYKKWKDDQIIEIKLKDKGNAITLKAHIANRTTQSISFIWDSQHSFAEVISLVARYPYHPTLIEK